MIPAIAGAPYSVPPEPSKWPAMALAALVHAGLVGFLAIGINWQSAELPAVEAEIWDVTTEMAAPPPPPQPEPVAQPEPEPTPPPAVEQPAQPTPPDIALEREKQRKQKEAEEKEKRIAEEKAQKLKEKQEKERLAKEKQRKAEQERIARIRKENLARMAAELGGAGTAAQSRAPRSDPGYVASLTAKIKSNIIYAGSRDVEGNPHAIYRIEQLPTGEVISYKKIRSSGIPEYDRAVEQAIVASSPLPKKKDGTVERKIEPVFRLKD